MAAKKRSKRRMYLDYASATPPYADAVRAVVRAELTFANPGSIHHEGVRANDVLEDSRARIAAQLACKAREIVFVSGGTEANNLAILGHARALESLHRTLEGTHWIVSKIEHPSVLECFAEVERLGGRVTHLDVDSCGRVSPTVLRAALRPETVFVSIGWANHEIGTIQHISDLTRTVRAHGQAYTSTVIFHTDAGQAPLYRSPQVHTLGVDILTLDSGKMYGPRGVGVVYISNRTELVSTMFGGSQERSLRPGTPNVALAVGFARAFEILNAKRSTENKRVRVLRDALAHRIATSIANVEINGDIECALPHILNISVKDVDCEYLTLALDAAGVAVATKSACREGEESRSHVVDAIMSARQDADWRAQRTLRISLGERTTEADIKRTSLLLAQHIELYRSTKKV